MNIENEPGRSGPKLPEVEIRKTIFSRLPPFILTLLVAGCGTPQNSPDAGATVDGLARSSRFLDCLRCSPTSMVIAGIIGATIILGKRWLDEGTVKKPKHWDNRKR